MPVAIPLVAAAVAGGAAAAAANSAKKAGQAAANSQPTYAQSVADASNAQMSLLPAQVAVDRAARMGLTYTDPASGRTYDFSGMGDAQLNELDAAQQARLSQAGADIQRNLTQQQYTDLMDLLPKYNELNLQSQRDTNQANIDASGQLMKSQADLSLQYQPIFGDLQRSEDQKTFLQNLDLGEQGTRRFSDLQNELLPAANRAGLDAQSAAVQAGMDSLRTSDPERYALMKKLLASADEDLSAGSSLTAEQLDNMQQNVRGAQAARGNILGAGAGYDEGRMASEMGQNLQQQRRASALAILQGSDVAPKFSAASAVNPLMPNFQSATPVVPRSPGFQATTTAGPNLNPASITQSGQFSVVNPGSVAGGADAINRNWAQKSNILMNLPNPWAQGLGTAANTFASMYGAGGKA